MAIQDFEDWTVRAYWDYEFTVLQDTPGAYTDAAKKSVVVNDTETGLQFSNANLDDHSDRHEDGGADPITNLGGNVAFPDRSYWRLELSSAQGISVDVLEKVALDVVVIDNRGEFDLDNNRIVVEKAGFYLLCASVYFRITSSGDRIFGYLLLNGSDRIAGNCFEVAGAQYTNNSIACGCYLSAGDYIELWVKNFGSDDTIETHSCFTFFTGCLIA